MIPENKTLTINQTDKLRRTATGKVAWYLWTYILWFSNQICVNKIIVYNIIKRNNVYYVFYNVYNMVKNNMHVFLYDDILRIYVIWLEKLIFLIFSTCGRTYYFIPQRRDALLKHVGTVIGIKKIV